MLCNALTCGDNLGIIMYIHHFKGADMTVALRKWGNSLALRVPKDIASSLDIGEGSDVEMVVQSGTLVIKPKKNSLLEKLVSQINSDNLHSEISTGTRVGNEEW